MQVAFLDRDSTINVDFGFVATIDKWQFLPSVQAAMRMMREAGYAIAIVTNQSAIATGRCSTTDVERLHEFMRAALALEGVKVDAVAYCPPSATDGCECRKPTNRNVKAGLRAD
jgi:HAD-superfamily hydrolase, subfamily IIIA